MANTALKLKKPVRKAETSGKAEQEYLAFRKTSARLVGDGSSRSLPASLDSFLAALNREVSRGRAVTIVQNETTLTTVEAAGLLGTSRQFIVNVLERGEIPFHFVGTHRRVYARDLLRYKTARDKRIRTWSDLARAEAEEGIYDAVPYPVPVDGG